MIATESTEDTERINSVLSVAKKGGNQFSLVVICTATFDVKVIVGQPLQSLITCGI